MLLNKKNEGIYVPYELTGSALSFKSGALTIDLSRCERDDPVSLDISQDASGKLVLGPAYRYIAQLDIPARTYTIDYGAADDFGFPQLKKIAAPLDTDKVSLTLWSLEV